MSGLARICKMYGSMEVSDANGKKATLLWDYANDKPRLKSEMTKEEIMASVSNRDTCDGCVDKECCSSTNGCLRDEGYEAV